jgi:purine catabolism regulator
MKALVRLAGLPAPEAKMSITVRELMQLPHLQMSLLAGHGGIDREVTWVHTSDLPDPWQWHGRGELLLTNGTALAADGAAQAHFAEQVAEAGASGMAIGLGMSGPPLTATAAQRADELALPLLTVPFSVPFTAVVRAVADANDREEASQLRRVARLYELLRVSMAAGRHGPDMFRRIGDELGVRIYLVDPATGRSLFDDQAESAYASVLAASYAAHGHAIPGMLRLRLPTAEPTEACAFAVAVPGDAPTALLVEALSDQLPSPVLLQHIAVGGALELAQLTAGHERQRRDGADLLARILDRRIYSAAAGSQLAEFGLDFGTSVLVVANSAEDRAADLDRRLARTRMPHILLYRDQLLYLVLADADVNAGLLSALLSSSVGVSDVIRTADRMVEAAQEARWALGASQAENRDFVRYGDQTVLLLPRTTAEATVLVSRVLGTLVEHDAERGTEYLSTLRVMLRLDRSWQLAATELHIHKQTLGYRIRRIEQITGRGFTKTEHIAELWIALQAYDLLTDHVGGSIA